MKETYSAFMIFGILLISLTGVNALDNSNACDLSVSLLNQDPYPAVQGDYVKLLFQVDGVQNTRCGQVTLSLVTDYPFSLNPGEQQTYQISSGTFASDFSGQWIVPFKVRVDNNALDGDNKIKVSIKSSNKLSVEYSFDVNIRDLRADFEVSVKDYLPESNKLTFQILNTGKYNVEALTVDIPKQENIEVKGTNKNIVGSLNANEDTTFDFEAMPKNGIVRLNLIYTDENGVRRNLEKEVSFDDSYFINRAGQVKSTSPWFYISLLLILYIVASFFWRMYKKRKAKQKARSQQH